MTVSTTQNRVSYAGNGVTLAFAFPYVFFDNADLVVLLAKADGTFTTALLGTDYTVTGAGLDAGGTVAMATPPASGTTLVIYRNPTMTQPQAFVDNDPLPAKSISRGYDRLTLIAQRLREMLDRSFRLSDADTSGASPVLPTPTPNAFIGWNGVGTGLVNRSITDLITISAYGTAVPDKFVGDGATKDFTLSANPGALANLDVSIGGITQVPTRDFTWDGSTKLSFVSAPPAPTTPGDTNIYVRYLRALPQGVFDLTAAPFTQTGAGAVSRTGMDKLRDTVSVKDFGAVGDGVADDTAAIQRAIDFASSNGAALRVLAGTYKLVPATPVAVEDNSYTTYAALVIRSNMHIAADRGAVFKIADGVSTDAAPKPMAMFCTNGVLSNVSWVGLTMDMNGANNPISPARPATYNRYNQSHILVSGTPGGIAARMDDVLVDRCVFLNTPGTNCIVTAQSNSPNVKLGARWVICRNLFKNNGLDTDDHSSVFAWSDDVQCFGNTFTTDKRIHEVGKTGGTAAYEVHGQEHRFYDNKIENYFRGLWVAPNLSTEVINTLIHSNSFFQVFYGVDFFRTAANQSEIRNTIISGNVFYLDDWSYAGAPTQKVGVLIACDYTIRDVLITGNVARKSGAAVGSVFCDVYPGAVPGQTHDNIVIENNVVRWFSNGVVLQTNVTNGLGSVRVKGNSFVELTPSTSFAVPTGIFTSGTQPMKTLSLNENSFVDERNSPQFQYGVYLGGVVTDLYVGPQIYKGMTTGNYFENGLVATNRKGFYSNVVLAPTWRGGATPVTIGNGSATARYDVTNDTVTLNAYLSIGTTTVLPAGAIQLDLPFPAAVSGLAYMGHWRMYNAGVFTFGVAEVDGTASVLSLQVNGGTNASYTAPVALAPGNIVSVQITYRKP